MLVFFVERQKKAENVVSETGLLFTIVFNSGKMSKLNSNDF